MTRPKLTLVPLVVAIGALFACDGLIDDSETPLEPIPRLGKGKGGGGGSNPSPGMLIAAQTSGGLANALTGDGRDFDGAAGLPAGEGNYQDDKCEVGFSVSTNSSTDTTTANLFTDQGGKKRRDACAESNLVRVIELSFPPNPDLGVENVQNITFRWQADQADEVGEVTWARGKITMFDATTCAPIRFNPLRAGYEASSLIQVERIDGGWRLWTDASPNNVGQCEDRTSGSPGVPGALFNLEFEYTIDEDVGDGAGSGG